MAVVTYRRRKLINSDERKYFIVFSVATLSFLLLYTSDCSAGENQWTEQRAMQFAGYVLFRKPSNATREYLLIKKKRPAVWIIPNGKINKEERRPIAATRQLIENTGLTPDNITTIDYKKVFMHGKPKKIKESAYYTGKVEDGNITITLDAKFSAYKWANFSGALQDLDVASQHALRECDKYFQENGY